MNSKTLRLSSVVLALCAAYPAVVFAAAPASGAYVTDIIEQYVEDEASKVLSGANNVLCYMAAMAPEAMVNQSPYVALIDSSKCNSDSGGGRSGNNGATYEKAVVDSTQATGAALIAKVWIENPHSYITAKASATQSPSATLPYGEFVLNWCGTGAAATAGSCNVEKGFITAASTGLSYFASGSGRGQGITAQTDALTLNASNADSGSGTMNQTATLAGGGSASVAITFAYNATHFLRSSDSGVTQVCFDRSLTNADKSAWSYGLYDSTGARVTRNSGFPVEYTDPATNTLVNGYIGYWGFWSQSGTTPPTGTTLSQITYSATAPVRTAYTLMQSGGKLLKHTATATTLAAVDKQRFWFGSDRDLRTAGVPLSNPFTWTQYELYWDNAAGVFKVSGIQNTTTGNMETLATPVAISNADMVTAASWGLYAWTNGSQWSVDNTAIAALATTGATTAVRMVTEDIVYPDQYAAVGALKCVNDCPQATAANGTPAFLNDYWTTPSVLAANVLTYTPDAASGNLLNGVTPVLNLSTTNQWSSAFSTQGSGKLVDATAWTAITTANPTGPYTAADLATQTTFYTWQSSANSWDQLSVLKDNAGVVVRFDAPLRVDFTVPANTAGTSRPYGVYAGSTISLDYGGFGDLWGIPSSCIDLSTNLPCDFAVATTAASQANFSWKPDFSIPFNGAADVNTTGGVVVAGATTYYVKPLMQEVRFQKVANSACSGSGLTFPTSTPSLPLIGGWTDPALGAAATPANTAPRVIDGVVKY